MLLSSIPLLEINLGDLVSNLLNSGISLGGRILAALVIFIVGRLLISFLNKMFARILERRKVDAGIQSFLKSLVNILLMILLIVAVIGKLGIETTSFAALLASAGVAVGMALSGNLQNFAGGLIILLFRPYKVGDWVECQNESGLGRYQNKRKMNEVFQIKPVNSDNDKFVICLGQFKVSEIDFPTKEAAKKYLRSKPWEIIVNTAILAAKATYIEANEKFNNQNSEENGNN